MRLAIDKAEAHTSFPSSSPITRRLSNPEKTLAKRAEEGGSVHYSG